jgi:hypothetical protein
MRSENGTRVDLEALNELLRRADVLTIGFSLFTDRILVDTRTNDRQGQLVTLAEPVGSVQERYLWLGRHRGAFPAPQAFSFFVWPHTVRELIDRNSLAELEARLEPEAAQQFTLLLDKAAAMERQAILSAVRGDENYPALWQRTGNPRGGPA